MRTHNIPFQYKKENHTILSQICSQWIFSKGLKNEFETIVVNDPSVFVPLKFYCTLYLSGVQVIQFYDMLFENKYILYKLLSAGASCDINQHPHYEGIQGKT